METVSIIIPVFNAESYIELCLDSVLVQTYKKLQVILVDDGSSDASGEICDNYRRKDPRITVYHRANSGVSATRNFGFDRSTGEYILFLDADDSIEPDMIEGCVQLAKSHQADVVVCSFRYYMIDDNHIIENSLESDFCGSAEEIFHDWFNVLVEKEILNPPWNKLIRRDLLISNNIRFDQRFSICEDMAFSIQTIAASRKTVLTRNMYYNYYLKNSGTLVFRFHENYFEALTNFYEITLRYCQSFDDHKTQLKCLNTLYVNLCIMYFKQICTKSNWSKSYQYKKLKEIALYHRFLDALKTAEISYKKKFVCIFLRIRQYSVIHFLYKMTSTK